MTRRRLVAILLAWQFLQEFIPFYAVYALFFADHGLSDAQISLLFIVWSVVAIGSEIPSGAWADTVPRRRLLALASVLFGGCFACWALVPNIVGFATGFVLWGLSGALSSGTFQALAYDELTACVGAEEAQPWFARVIGWGSSLSLVAVTVAMALATPLLAVGGYALVAWTSVAIPVVQLALVLILPETPRTLTAAAAADLAEDDALPVPAVGVPLPGTAPPTARSDGPAAHGFVQPFRQWWTTLRSGLRIAVTDRVIRGAVLAGAGLMGLSALDEYFGLLLRDQGASLAAIPLLLALVSAAQAAAGLCVERVSAWSSGRLAGVVAVAALCLGAGALVHHPIGVVGVAAGYGLITLAILVSQVRQQRVTPTKVRATVTSVSGAGSEGLAVLVYAAYGLGSGAVGLAGVTLGIAVLLLLVSPVFARLIPDRRATD